MTPLWADYYRFFQYAFTKDPLARKIDIRNLTGAGISQPDGIPSMGPDGSMWGGNDQRIVRYHESNDFIDLSTVSNRQSRYKEYERLRGVAEIEMAMTVFADEACVHGDTKVATPFGFITIKELSQTKQPEEKFLVYCYDFEKKDISLSWGYNPRLVKKEKVVTIVLDNGDVFKATADHRVLKRDGTWINTGDLKFGDKLMPFYRLKANPTVTKNKYDQYPRIYTHVKGWIHERQLVDEWRTGKENKKLERVNKVMRLISSGLTMYQITDIIGHDWKLIKGWLKKAGFSVKEGKIFSRLSDHRRVVGVSKSEEADVYDLSVENHQNFCGESIIFHNCQKDENSHIFKIECDNTKVKEELEFLFYHRLMLNMDRRSWSDFKNLCTFGDLFYEIILNPDSPSDGIVKIAKLPPESIYRIETTKGKVVEFQQSKEGPDYQSLLRAPVTQATDSEIQQATAVRFAPEQIVHIRIGDDRKTFYPYGISLIEAARGPAHSLRLMEDAMLVYRLCLVGDTRIRTPEGYKLIKDIAIGDTVYSVAKNDKIFKTTVKHAVNNGVKDVYRVRSRHVEIIGTDTHPILVNRNGEKTYVEIKNLVIGKDKLLLQVNNCGKDIEILGQNNKEINLPKYVNEEFARLFGFLIGNGFVNNEAQFGFVTNPNNNYNIFYYNLLKKFFSEVIFNDGKYTVYNKIGHSILTAMGYKNHESGTIPEWVFQTMPNIRKAFIEGILDTNACKNFSTIEFSNKKLIEDIKELWSSIGLCSGHINSQNDATSHSVTISGCLLPATENVISVIPVGQQEVFDIEVDNEEHNFIANGIPVHNSRAPERRVFYIDVGQLPPFKAEAFIERLKDQFRKKKVATSRSPFQGANQVEERWHAPAADEDYWLPIRPNSNTKIDTLPGASNLGEIDDAIYFRNKLFTALNFPKNYFSNEDPNSTRITLSSQDVKFARMIERLQSYFEDGLWEIADRHLQLRGYPQESYDDMKIKMTPPSDWRELSRNEVTGNRINYASSLKSALLMADFDVLTKWMKYTEDEAEEIIARLKIQKLEDLKLQVMAQNPQILGIGNPGQNQQGQEIGAEPGGPNPMISPEGGGEQSPPPEQQPSPSGGEEEQQPKKKKGTEGAPLPEAEAEDIKKYDLEIQDYESEEDIEPQDYSVGES